MASRNERRSRSGRHCRVAACDERRYSGLVSEVHPTGIKNRAEDEVKKTVKDTKQMIYDTVDGTRRYFVDESGVRWNNLGTVALIAVGVVTVIGAASGVSALFRKATK